MLPIETLTALDPEAPETWPEEVEALIQDEEGNVVGYKPTEDSEEPEWHV